MWGMIDVVLTCSDSWCRPPTGRVSPALFSYHLSLYIHHVKSSYCLTRWYCKNVFPYCPEEGVCVWQVHCGMSMYTALFFFFVKYVFRCGLIFAVNISEICETEKLWFSSSLCGIFCVVWECEPVCSLVTFWENAVKKIWKLHHSEPSTFNLKVFQLNVNLTKHMVWH